MYNIVSTINPKENYYAKNVYPKKLKESIFKRLAPPNAEKVPALAKETNIPTATLCTWRSKVIKNNPTSNKKSSKWSSSDKFQAVLETASLSELETAKYCREKGIHVEELKSWIKHCQNANETKLEDPKELKDNLKKEQIKQQDWLWQNISKMNNKIDELLGELVEKGEK